MRPDGEALSLRRQTSCWDDDWSGGRQRAAAVMSLVHSARLNGHDPYAYLRDALERLLTQPASRIAELLPHHWRPAI